MKVNIGDISESELDLVMSAIRMSVLEEDKRSRSSRYLR